MTDFIKRSWAEINLDCAIHNYNEIKAGFPARLSCAVLSKRTATDTVR